MVLYFYCFFYSVSILAEKWAFFPCRYGGKAKQKSQETRTQKPRQHSWKER